MWQSVVQEDWVSHWSQSYVAVCSTGRFSVSLESKLCDSLWYKKTECLFGIKLIWQSVVQEDWVSHWSHSYVTVCNTRRLCVSLGLKVTDVIQEDCLIGVIVMWQSVVHDVSLSKGSHYVKTEWCEWAALSRLQMLSLQNVVVSVFTNFLPLTSVI